MIHEDEREIIEFLYRVAHDSRYSRRVVYLRGINGRGSDGTISKGAFLSTETRDGSHSVVESITCEPENVESLSARGYIDGTVPTSGTLIGRITLSAKGIALHEDGYTERLDAPATMQTQHNYVYGSAAIAQTQTGNVAQHIGTVADLEEVRQLLSDLHEAINRLGVSDEEREEYVVPVAQLQDQLSAPSPRRARLLMAWGAIQAFATIESTIQGAERVQHLIQALAPHMTTLLQTLS